LRNPQFLPGWPATKVWWPVFSVFGGLERSCRARRTRPDGGGPPMWACCSVFGQRVDYAPAPSPTTTRQTPNSPVPATPTPSAQGSFTPPPCLPGTVFSPMGVEPCRSPVDRAQIERGEALAGAGHGPVEVCGPLEASLDPRLLSPRTEPRAAPVRFKANTGRSSARPGSKRIVDEQKEADS